MTTAQETRRIFRRFSVENVRAGKQLSIYYLHSFSPPFKKIARLLLQLICPASPESDFLWLAWIAARTMATSQTSIAIQI